MSDKITQKKRTQSVKGEDVIERLRSVLDQSKLSGRQFAEKIGLKAESATRLFNGVTGLTKPLAFAIELHFGVRSEWLLTGEGLRASDYRTLLDASEQALLECKEVNMDNWTNLMDIGVELEMYKKDGDFNNYEKVIANLLNHIAIELNQLNEIINERKEHNAIT